MAGWQCCDVSLCNGASANTYQPVMEHLIMQLTQQEIINGWGWGTVQSIRTAAERWARIADSDSDSQWLGDKKERKTVSAWVHWHTFFFFFFLFLLSAFSARENDDDFIFFPTLRSHNALFQCETEIETSEKCVKNARSKQKIIDLPSFFCYRFALHHHLMPSLVNCRRRRCRFRNWSFWTSI